MTHDNVNNVLDEPFESLLSRYQIRLETSITGSNFIFDSIQLSYYKCHKVNFKRSESYIGSPDWIKKQQ